MIGALRVLGRVASKDIARFSYGYCRYCRYFDIVTVRNLGREIDCERYSNALRVTVPSKRRFLNKQSAGSACHENFRSIGKCDVETKGAPRR